MLTEVCTCATERKPLTKSAVTSGSYHLTTVSLGPPWHGARLQLQIPYFREGLVAEGDTEWEQQWTPLCASFLREVSHVRVGTVFQPRRPTSCRLVVSTRVGPCLPLVSLSVSVSCPRFGDLLGMTLVGCTGSHITGTLQEDSGSSGGLHIR